MSDNITDDQKWLARADEARAEGHATPGQVDELVAKLGTVEDDATKDSTTE